VAEKCALWLRDLDAALPTIIVVARDPDGNDIADVRVLVDEELRWSRLDGRPWPLDPGPHHLRLEHAPWRMVERQLVLIETEHNRRVEVVFSRAPSESAPRHSTPLAGRAMPGGTRPGPAAALEDGSSISPVSWVGFSVGAAALVVGTVTGAVSLDRINDIKDRCPNNVCSAADADQYRSAATLARVSTLSFIAAAAGTTVGLVSLFVLRKDDRKDPTLRATLGSGLGLEGRF